MLNINHGVRLIIILLIPFASEPRPALHPSQRTERTPYYHTQCNDNQRPRSIHEPQHDGDVAFVPRASRTVAEEGVFFRVEGEREDEEAIRALEYVRTRHATT